MDFTELRIQAEDLDWLDNIEFDNTEERNQISSIKRFLSKFLQVVSGIDFNLLSPVQTSHLQRFANSAANKISVSRKNSSIINIKEIFVDIKSLNDSNAGYLFNINQNTRTANQLVEEIRKNHSFISSEIDKKVHSTNIEIVKLDEKAEKLDKKADSLEQAIVEANDKFKKDYDDLYNNINNKIELINKEFKNQNDSIIASLNNRLSDSEKIYRDNIDDLKREIKQQYLDNIEYVLEEEIQNTNNSIRTIIEKVEKDRQTVEDLKKIVSRDALTTDFSKAAIENRRAAKFWRWTTVLAMAGSLLLVLYVLFLADLSQVGVVVVRVSVLFALVPLSVYSAFQAGRFRFLYEKYQSAALQLTALKPYLEDVNEDDRDNILRMFAVKLFIYLDLHDQKHLTDDAKVGFLWGGNPGDLVKGFKEKE